MRSSHFSSALRFAACALTTLCAAVSAQAQQVIFQETFASNLGQFSSVGSVATGTYGARMRGASGTKGAITSAAINAQGYTGLSLTFTRSTSGLDSGEAGVASYSTDGVTYTVLESLQSASGTTTLSLPAAAASSQLRLRFAVNASSTLETYSVDNIELKGTVGSGGGGGGGTGTLPPVNSVDADGPFATTITKSTGPSRDAWVVRPSTLGANGLKHPVFIWGPGAGTGPAEYEFHLKRIASHGFVVFSVTSTGDGTEMKAAIDWLISENSRSASPYYQKLNTARIAAGGHSRGSVSTFAVASDSRLTTTIHVAGGSFDGNGSANLRKPAAYICGEADTLATPNCERDYTATRVPVWFTIMDGVSHTQAARSGLPAIVGWLRWHLGGETGRSSMFLPTSCDFCGGIWDTKRKNW
jgi:hypothetical protein